MKMMMKVLSAAAVFGLIALQAAAVNDSATGSGDAGGTILRKLYLEEVHDLEFGDILRPASGCGTCFVDMFTKGFGVAYCTGGPVAQTTGTNEDGAAVWYVEGTAGEDYVADLPTTITLDHIGPPVDTIVVTVGSVRSNNSADYFPCDFGTNTTATALGGGDYRMTFEATNNDCFTMAGSIPVCDTTLDGRYDAQYPVVITYF